MDGYSPHECAHGGIAADVAGSAPVLIEALQVMCVAQRRKRNLVREMHDDKLTLFNTPDVVHPGSGSMTERIVAGYGDAQL